MFGGGGKKLSRLWSRHVFLNCLKEYEITHTDPPHTDQHTHTCICPTGCKVQYWCKCSPIYQFPGFSVFPVSIDLSEILETAHTTAKDSNGCFTVVAMKWSQLPWSFAETRSHQKMRLPFTFFLCYVAIFFYKSAEPNEEHNIQFSSMVHILRTSFWLN